MKLRLVQLMMIAAMAVGIGNGLAQAQGRGPQECGFYSASGGFAFRSEGTFPDGSKSVFVGTMIFDGAGKVSGINTGSISGFVFKDSFGGTYSINKDCTGTYVGVFSTGSVHWDIVVADNGKKIFGIISDQGYVFSFEAIKQ